MVVASRSLGGLAPLLKPQRSRRFLNSGFLHSGFVFLSCFLTFLLGKKVRSSALHTRSNGNAEDLAAHGHKKSFNLWCSVAPMKYVLNEYWYIKKTVVF